MSRDFGDDEDRVRVRPNPRGSRPRTKERPKHVDAEPAQVITVDRGRYGCLTGSFALSAPDAEPVTAMKARELGRAGVVVGDRVGLVGDVSGAPGSLARIVRVEPRRSVLRRSADDNDPVERVIVANADQLAIVTAIADPQPRTGLVDRCLVAAYDAGLRPLLVLTKADLGDPAEFLANYAALDVPFVVTGASGPRTDDGSGPRPDGALDDERDDVTQPGGTDRAGTRIDGLADVLAELAGRVTVLVGHSGVGKSTLVNALVPGADRATGRVNDVTGRGRHTSTSAIALALPPLSQDREEAAGWVVDTPGIRSFGLAHVDPNGLLAAFGDLSEGTGECPRGCSHDEPECGLDAWVGAGNAGTSGRARLDSYRRLLRSRLTPP